MKHRFGAFTMPLEHNPRWASYHGEDIEMDVRRHGNDFLETRLSVKQFPSCDTCLFLSDLHWLGDNVALYERIASFINEKQVDWLLFGGDLCVYMDTANGALDWLSRLHAKKGKVAVLGNRETQVRWHGVDYWKSAYASIGFTLLVNEVLDTGDFVIYGVDDFRYGTPQWAAVPTRKYCIALSHNPDAVASFDGRIGHLALCGHTHGGQFVFPIVGAPYTSSIYGRQFLHGLSRRDDGAMLYTNNGIGESGFGWFHRRICCPRELLFVHKKNQ